MLTASILLAIMILPTSCNRLWRAYPKAVRRCSGAGHGRPSKSVFFTRIVPLQVRYRGGRGCAVGETMAVIMVAGNNTWMPQGLLGGIRTMTSNIVLEMGYASGLHRKALIATGVVLFVFILIINLCVSLLNRRRLHE